MYLENAVFENFRNIEKVSFTFSRGVNTVLIFTAPTTDPLTVGMVYLVRLSGTLA